MNIAQQLLRGSAEIDRMQQEVKATVGILVGLLPSDADLGWPEWPVVFSKRGDYNWMVYRDTSREARNRPGVTWPSLTTVSCHFLGSSPPAFSSECDTLMLLRHVQAVYQTLPSLVEDLVERFEDLPQYHWKFLLEAAKAAS